MLLAHVAMGAWRATTFFVSAMIAAAVCQAAQVQRLLAIERPGRLNQLDTTTADTLDVITLKYEQPWLLGLAHRNGRLLSIVNGTGWGAPDYLAEINPADGNVRYLGPMGYYTNSGGIYMKYHPLTGVLTGVANTKVVRIDDKTGSVAVVATISPGPHGTKCLAIDSQGRAYTTRTTIFGTTLYELDLQTGALTELGTMALLTPGFVDLEFDAQDRLWGIYADGWAPYEDGIYRIDIASVSAWPVRITPHIGGPYFYGLAFVPEPAGAPYCTAKVNSAGCAPSIAGDGWPSSSAVEGFSLRAAEVLNQTSGLLLYGVAGPSAIPFAGGTLCVAAPRQRTPVVASGGSPSGVDCTGVWTRDFNTWHAHYPTLPPGTTVYAQWYGRDPGLTAPANVQLSNALEFVLLP